MSFGYLLLFVDTHEMRFTATAVIIINHGNNEFDDKVDPFMVVYTNKMHVFKYFLTAILKNSRSNIYSKS